MMPPNPLRPVYPRVADRLKKRRRFVTRTKQATSTLVRVALPTALATIIGFVYFDNLSLYIRSTLDLGTIRILQADDAQFIQNFLTVIGLLFSILAGNAYSALYQQQESIYFALFQEVSEAKSLLEQTTLVCQGRPFYQSALACIRDYVKNDLRRLDVSPAELLSTRPMEDPLESIMYMTSVGVPSIVYETVKNLRQARGSRLGAMQRKFPFLGIALLYLLASVELLAFPLLGAGTATITGVLSLQSFLFACLCGAHMLVLRIIQELWQSSGGVFNVDEVLQQMVFGLEEELEMRSKQASTSWPAGGASPSGGAMPGATGSAAEQLRAAMMGNVPSSVAAATPSGYVAAGAIGDGGRATLPNGAMANGADASGGGDPSAAPLPSQQFASSAADAAADPGRHAGPAPNGADADTAGALPMGEPRNLPRPQRAFLGRVGRAMMEAIQVIGR